MRSLVKITAALLSIGVGVGLSSAARADLIVSYSTNGGATFSTLISQAGTNQDVTAGTTTLSDGLVVGASEFTNNVPGATAGAFETGSTLKISNNTGSAQTVEFFIGSGLFTSPTQPGFSLNSSISATAKTLVTGNTFSEFGCVFSTSTMSGGCAGTDTGTNHVTDAPGGASVSANSTVAVPTLSTPFELGGLITITLQNGASDTIGGQDTFVSVPEPASIALLGSGLLGLGMLRRRRA